MAIQHLVKGELDWHEKMNANMDELSTMAGNAETTAGNAATAASNANTAASEAKTAVENLTKDVNKKLDKPVAGTLTEGYLYQNSDGSAELREGSGSGGMGADVLSREVMAPYGFYGIEFDLDELMTYVKNGQFDKFAIGDYIIDTMTTGEQVIWEIADKNGFLHTGDTEFTKNSIVLCPRDCLSTTYKYNSSNTNSGGYAGSLMPNNLETEANKFSAKLQSYMQTVRRLENNKGTWAWASRRIFLPSTLEVLGHQGWADYYSGGPICHSLALFTGGNAHVMKGRGYNKKDASRQWYWLADPSSANTTDFCYVYYNGSSNDAGASNSHGVAPLIVVGGDPTT